MKSWRFSVLSILMATASIRAHLLEGSLKPAGGESFKPGDVMTIEWVATQAHTGKYDIYFSKDGGKTWPTEFAEGWQGSKTDNAKNAYRWTIPAGTTTTQGRIRVCQLFGGHCTEPGTYTLSSENFTISNTAGLPDGMRTGIQAPSIRFHSKSRTIEVAFDLSEASDVSLLVFDADGKLQESLLEGRLQAGAHSFSVPTGQLESVGPRLFRLKRGDDVTSRIWGGR